MKIAMFMLFFVCNMFTVLIMRFAYESNYRYNNGMLIGVHIPGDHVNDDDVTRLMTRFKKSMKYFQNINHFRYCVYNLDSRVRFRNYVYPAFSASENVSVKDTEWLVCGIPETEGLYRYACLCEC